MRAPANDEASDLQPERDWEDFARTQTLTNARVVAILDEDGGAIVETHPALQIHEGRMETYGVDGQGKGISSLDYGLAFHPKGEKVGEEQIGFPASIVIKGTAENGKVLEIRGKGFIGHDEFGQLDGIFHAIPSVYVPSEKDLREHVERESSGGGPTIQGEFILATYGRAQDWS